MRERLGSRAIASPGGAAARDGVRPAGEGHPGWRIVRTGTLAERTTRSATLPAMR